MYQHPCLLYPSKKKKPNPRPVRFDQECDDWMKELQRATKPHVSISEIIQCAVRYCVPRYLKGELPMYESPVIIRRIGSNGTKK